VFFSVFTSATRFGSGWTWLCVDADGKLFITSSPNQDPTDGHRREKGHPVGIWRLSDRLQDEIEDKKRWVGLLAWRFFFERLKKCSPPNPKILLTITRPTPKQLSVQSKNQP
jgi:hypothetical protein